MMLGMVIICVEGVGFLQLTVVCVFFLDGLKCGIGKEGSIFVVLLRV